MIVLPVHAREFVVYTALFNVLILVVHQIAFWMRTDK
jgi:hypothetical protein